VGIENVYGKRRKKVKEALTLPKKELTPMDVILNGLRPTMDDEHEKKKLKEWDEIKSGKIMNIFRKEKKHGIDSKG